MKTSLHSSALMCTFLFGSTLSIFAQGSLTPPGAPGPTFKTLQQVEPRTPIDATHTPGDGTNQFIINTPGSYYLTGNITGVSGKNGISINADNVTVDLNGFALIGVGGSLDGINVPAAHRNLRLHNGSAQSWAGTGISSHNARNSQFDHLRVSQNGLHGLSCGNGCVVSSCTAAANAGDGILTSDSCTVTACTSVSNANGFSTDNRCTIIGCTATLNTGYGIYPISYCTVKDCTASGNTFDGIHFADSCLITGNNASNNGRHGFNSNDGSGQLNRIDGNTASVNGQNGFRLANDLVVRNNAYNNTTANYNPTSAPAYGPVQIASTATNPWANF